MLSIKKTTSLPGVYPRLSRGYSLVEVLGVTLMIGVLAAVVMPSWLGFVERQRLNTTSSQVLQQIRRAQRQARQQKTPWQISFQENNEGRVQWRLDENPDITAPDAPCQQNTGWNSFQGTITLDSENTTFPSPTSRCWRIQFDEKGQAIGDDGFYNGKVTLSAQATNDKRCIFISTFLGAMREAKNQACESN